MVVQGQSSKNRALISLAILKVDMDEQRGDYLSYLRGFALYVLKKHRPEPVNDRKVSKLIEDDFGIKIPSRICQLLVKRLTTEGYLEKSDGIYLIKSEIPETRLEEKSKAVLRGIEDVNRDLIRFAAAEFAINWSEEEGSAALISFLKHFDLEFMRYLVHEEVLPGAPDASEKSMLVVSRFIKFLKEEKRQNFEKILTLVKGYMLANALVCHDLASIGKSFKGVLFFLDAPLVIRLLGLHGQEELEAALELLNLVKSLGGKFSIFEHGLDEARRILSWCGDNVENLRVNDYGLRDARELGLKKSDFIILREGLERKLEELGVDVSKSPPYIKETQISEADLEKFIRDEIAYRSDNALLCDINSIRSIYALRGLSKPRKLENSKFVFVTHNSSLAKAALKFGRVQRDQNEVAAVITDFSLANIAWLKSPMEFPSTPEKELMAACYAAMEPPEAFYEKYLQEVDRLQERGAISIEDYAVLRANTLAPDELMTVTQGSEEALTVSNIKLVVERIKAKTVADKEKELADEREKLNFTEISLDGERAITANVKSRVDSLARKIARVVGGIFQLFMFVSMIAAVILSVFQSVGWAVVIFLLGVGIYGALLSFFGVGARQMAVTMENALYGWLSGRMKKLLFEEEA